MRCSLVFRHPGKVLNTCLLQAMDDLDMKFKLITEGTITGEMSQLAVAQSKRPSRKSAYAVAKQVWLQKFCCMYIGLGDCPAASHCAQQMPKRTGSYTGLSASMEAGASAQVLLATACWQGARACSAAAPYGQLKALLLMR